MTAPPPKIGRGKKMQAQASQGQEAEAEDTIGPRVAQLANRMKVKQTRIAQDCEISRISVNRFFRGRSEIRATDLVNVLKVLGIDLEQEIQKRLHLGL
jgi:transcriptional regulator with XRE-family HTH domain